MERVRVIHPLIGGSFGRKEDIGLQILAALGSFQTRRPVMLVNSREESIQYHTKRHAITLRYRTGVNSEGKVLVQEITIWGDTGAYACLGPAAISNCAQSAIGPYEVPNVLVEGFCVYTNNPPASMRGSPMLRTKPTCLVRLLLTAHADSGSSRLMKPSPSSNYLEASWLWVEGQCGTPKRRRSASQSGISSAERRRKDGT